MASEISNYSNTFMPDVWKDWVKENLANGIKRQIVFETLRKNGFGLGAISQELQSDSQVSISIDALGRDASGRTVDYAGLANCKLTNTANPNLKRINVPNVQLYTWDDFLLPEECSTLIKLTNTRLIDSAISTKGNEADYAFRTSKTCYLHEINHSIVSELDQKIAVALGISAQWSEPNQAQKYEIGQEFKAHTDYFEPGTEEYTTFAQTLGQRTWTFMIYLNESCEGGETHFRMLNKTFSPKMGQAVIWNSLTASGDPNPLTLHHGMKVSKGEKYIITKWFRDKGEGSLTID